VVEEGALAPVSKPPAPNRGLETVAERPPRPPELRSLGATSSTAGKTVVEEGALAPSCPVVEEGALAPVSKPPAPNRGLETVA
jgi:hypothetical protein